MLEKYDIDPLQLLSLLNIVALVMPQGNQVTYTDQQ